MRFLANENFPLAAVKAIRDAGHDCAWVLEDAPGSPDQWVLERALKERRVLLTFDKDFGELVFARGANASCGVVLFRSISPSPELTARLCLRTLVARENWEGNFAVVDRDRVRIRPLPTK